MVGSVDDSARQPLFIASSLKPCICGGSSARVLLDRFLLEGLDELHQRVTPGFWHRHKRLARVVGLAPVPEDGFHNVASSAQCSRLLWIRKDRSASMSITRLLLLLTKNEKGPTPIGSAPTRTAPSPFSGKHGRHWFGCRLHRLLLIVSDTQRELKLLRRVGSVNARRHLTVTILDLVRKQYLFVLAQLFN